MVKKTFEGIFSNISFQYLKVEIFIQIQNMYGTDNWVILLNQIKPKHTNLISITCYQIFPLLGRETHTHTSIGWLINKTSRYATIFFLKISVPPFIQCHVNHRVPHSRLPETQRRINLISKPHPLPSLPSTQFLFFRFSSFLQSKNIDKVKPKHCLNKQKNLSSV